MEKIVQIQIGGNTLSCPPSRTIGEFVLEQLELINKSRLSGFLHPDSKLDISKYQPYTITDVIVLEEDPSTPYQKYQFELSLCK